MSEAAAGGAAPPSVIGPGAVVARRYCVRSKIAEGTVASVYLADDVELGHPVALKVLDPLRGADPVGRLRFEREFEILCRLSHPGIARCLRFVRDDDRDVLVLELVEGETLETRLRRGRLPVDEAVAMALRLAEALQACHREGVLHRDLKPANVILHPERGPVILDFGVAWFGAAANLTRTGAVIGSPQYMAPEVFSSSLTDARADVYALGAILFEALTGRPVRMAEGVAELALAHLREAVPSASALRPEVGADLDGVVARAIAPCPEDRFATAGELAEALRRGAVSGGRGVKTRTPCAACRTPLIVELGFCPGCGRAVSWNLRTGSYAVQIGAVPDVGRGAAWLERRYGRALALDRVALRRRLTNTPVPLAVGVTIESAEQLAAEAAEVGCRADIVRARALVGARLRASAATTGESLVAGGLHVAAVTVVGALVKMSGGGDELLGLVPGLASLLGIVVAAAYVRRPLLRVARDTERRAGETAPAAFASVLGALKTDRARQVAASAVARAAPVLTGDVAGLTPDAREDALAWLGRALDAASAVDAHAALLASRSRSRLAVEMERARAAADSGDEEAMRRVVALRQERTDLVEASQAHDLAVRLALEASQRISAALSTRVTVAAVGV